MKQLLATALSLGLVTTAWAQETEMGGEMGGEMEMEEMMMEGGGGGMVLDEGQVGAGLVLGIGLDKDVAAEEIGLTLGGAYGVMENLQAGIDLNILLAHPVLDAALSGVTLGAQYQVTEFVAPTLDINIVHQPLLDEYKPVIGLSGPMHFVMSEGFAVNLLHDIMLRPGSEGAAIGTPLLYFGSDPYEKGFSFAAGAEMMASDTMKLGLDFAFILPDFDSDFRQLPLVISGAYAGEMMDIGLAFGFDNLAPPDPPGGGEAPGAADARYIAIFASTTM